MEQIEIVQASLEDIEELMRWRMEVLQHVFSLSEEFSRNKSIAQVGNNIREYHNMLVSQLGESHTTLEWNAGNHFQDGAARTARGFAWNLKF